MENVEMTQEEAHKYLMENFLNREPIDRLLLNLANSPANFQAVRMIADYLEYTGYQKLDAAEKWELKADSKYYLVKNQSAIFAFHTGTGKPSAKGFNIISSHSDSPCFKIKPNAEIYSDGGVVSLNVEKYGGGIMYTWFDRPLSIAGRVMLKGEDPLHPVSKLVDLYEPVCTIPHLAIHFNREVNEGNKLSVQKDMKPVVGFFSDEEIAEQKKHGGIIKMLVAKELDVTPEEILDYELCLYPKDEPQLIGAKQEYIQSGRLDDLEMAFASLDALMEADKGEASEATRVMAVFDNEETGSGTKQGAHSPVLRSLLERICLSLEPENQQAMHQAVANSFMISADNAHAWHPNYNEKYDPTNHPVIGGGPAVKINANCKYMTDADGAAVFGELCRKAGVKYQYFVNHSDVAGGSTLGNILTGQLDLRGVDMGAAIWAMHSAAETGGVKDYEETIKVFTLFYKL